MSILKLKTETTLVVQPKYRRIKSQLEELLHDFENIGEELTKGERNIIKKVEVDDLTLTIKKFKSPNAFQSLVYRFLRKSKAKRSFLYAKRLIDSGIKTPYPIAYSETFSVGLKESYYISMYVDYDFDFRTLIHNPKFENREAILRQFTTFTYKMHERNINFLDHSPGNTLIIERGDRKYDFYLIDLNRMRFEKMSFKKTYAQLQKVMVVENQNEDYV